MTEHLSTEYAEHEVEWHQIPGRGRVAALRVKEPGIAVGEHIKIGDTHYSIRAIEAMRHSNHHRWIGQLVGVVVLPVPTPSPGARMDYHRAATFIDALRVLALEHGYGLSAAVEHVDEPRQPLALRFTLLQLAPPLSERPETTSLAVMD